jgi:hypothetical protein
MTFIEPAENFHAFPLTVNLPAIGLHPAITL